MFSTGQWIALIVMFGVPVLCMLIAGRGATYQDREDDPGYDESVIPMRKK